MVRDERVKKGIVDHLYGDNRVDAAAIQVVVSDGRAVLRGRVPSLSAAIAAVEDSYAVEGVVYVENRLTVTPSAAVPIPTDRELKRNIEKVLKWNADLEMPDVRISVVEGRVVLEGAVSSYWRKVRVEEVVSPLKGVVEVVNKLAVVPTEKVSDMLLAERIVAGLDRNLLTNVKNILVEVENGRVRLSGILPNRPAFEAARDTVIRTAGVTEIRNDLIIR
jgi:osmotically-inducible protein OsmY